MERVMNDGKPEADKAAPDKADVIAPPPLIYLAAILAGVALDALWPAPFFPGAANLWLGGAIIVISFAIALACFRLFGRAGTTIPTNQPTSALVSRGPYRHSRNPIYVSMSLLLAGIAIAADNIWMLGLLAPVLLIINYGVILREEAYLERAFGDEYRVYKSRVRRWL